MTAAIALPSSSLPSPDYLRVTRDLRSFQSLASVVIPALLRQQGKWSEAEDIEQVAVAFDRTETGLEHLRMALIPCHRSSLGKAATCAKVSADWLVQARTFLEQGWMSQYAEAQGLASYNAIRGLQFALLATSRVSVSAAGG